MAKLLDTVLLLVLPASGKSEVRTFLASQTPEVYKNDFHMGPTVQLDDYPYVHTMRRVDEVLTGAGEKGMFFQANDRPFAQPKDWGTLINLLNEDYEQLVTQKPFKGDCAATHLFDRIDKASVAAGLEPRISRLPANLQELLKKALNEECAELIKNLEAEWTDLDGKTIVIEFARGGPDGSDLPLPAPFGYQYSLAQLSKNILSRAKVLYIWVTPEESRRKNIARTDPNDPGSILHHGVPEAVMFGDYGLDDMEYLVNNSGRPNTICVQSGDEKFYLPIARLDNRHDLTSFVRKEREDWQPAEIKALYDGLKEALDDLAG